MYRMYPHLPPQKNILRKIHYAKIYYANSIVQASMLQWLRALTFKHWISHRHGSSLTWDTCEMPGSAPVGQVVFLQVLQFSPTSD